MHNSRKRRLPPSEMDPGAVRRSLHKCYGPLIDGPLPEKFVELLRKHEALQDEDKKKQDG